MVNNQSAHNTPSSVPSLYLEQDEQGNPRVVANTVEPPRASDPIARHVRRTLELL